MGILHGCRIIATQLSVVEHSLTSNILKLDTCSSHVGLSKRFCGIEETRPSNRGTTGFRTMKVKTLWKLHALKCLNSLLGRAALRLREGLTSDLAAFVS